MRNSVVVVPQTVSHLFRGKFNVQGSLRNRNACGCSTSCSMMFHLFHLGWRSSALACLVGFETRATNLRAIALAKFVANVTAVTERSLHRLGHGVDDDVVVADVGACGVEADWAAVVAVVVGFDAVPAVEDGGLGFAALRRRGAVAG